MSFDWLNLCHKAIPAVINWSSVLVFHFSKPNDENHLKRHNWFLKLSGIVALIQIGRQRPLMEVYATLLSAYLMESTAYENSVSIRYGNPIVVTLLVFLIN